jgi:hypothetical protein
VDQQLAKQFLWCLTDFDDALNSQNENLKGILLIGISE